MLIWAALAIPLLGALFLALRYRTRLTWWEYLLPFAFAVALISVSKALCESVQVMDTEYWGGYAQKAVYEEEWDEEVPCTHAKYRTETYNCGDSSNPSRTCTREVFDGYEHSYDVDNHPPEWYMTDSNDERWNITPGYFHHLCQLWQERQFVEMNRDYHSVDGDAYVTHWKGEYETLVTTTKAHWYENRIQASNSILNPPPVGERDRKRLGLYDYPKDDGIDYPYVLPSGRYAGEADIRKTNALLGKSKQVQVFVLAFRDKTIEAGLKQEQHWKRGNKNELVICVGVNDADQVQWAHVFSWTTVEDLKIDVRNFVAAQSALDLRALNDWLKPQLEARWVRRRFREFSYLTVEPPVWVVALTLCLTLGVTVGTGYWTLHNEFAPGQPRRKPLRRVRRRL